MSQKNPPLSFSGFTGQRLVVKFGGSMAENKAATAAFLQELAALCRAGASVALVHGGGKRINAVMEQLGQQSEFLQGHRVTTPENMTVVQWVLSAEANKALVADLCALGVAAVGVSGQDADLFCAAPKDAHSGLTGLVHQVNPKLIQALWQAGFLPVISPVSAGPRHEAMNVNADIAAGWLAAALGADLLVCLTDVEEIYEDLSAKTGVLKTLSITQVQKWLDEAFFDGGMAPKLEGAVVAARAGCRVRIGGGQAPGGLGRLLNHPGSGATLLP